MNSISINQTDIISREVNNIEHKRNKMKYEYAHLISLRLGKKNLMRKNSVSVELSLRLAFFETLLQPCGAIW